MLDIESPSVALRGYAEVGRGSVRVVRCEVPPFSSVDRMVLALYGGKLTISRLLSRKTDVCYNICRHTTVKP